MIDSESKKDAKSFIPLTNQENGYFLNDENDPNNAGVSSNGSNLSKLIVANKFFNFVDNSTMHGVRYVFMRNTSPIRR